METPNKLLENFDVDLQEFYYRVILEEQDITKKWRAHLVRRALKEVEKAYIKATVNRYKSYIQFDTSAKRCAYVLKHGPCFTSAVAKYLLDVVQTKPTFIDKSLSKGELEICCLGGGPATDAVAVVKIIRHLYQSYWQRFKRTLNVTVTVIDLSEDWCVTARNLLKCLNNYTKLVGDKEMEITYKFYQANLTKKFDPEVQNVIKKADIITMIYFLSAVNGSKAKDDSQSMVERIMLNMKKDGLLFFLDSAVDKHYEILNKAAVKRRLPGEIYGPLVEEFHTLAIDSVKKFLDLYQKYFFRFVCMTKMFFCVSAWVKPTIVSPIRQIKAIIQDVPPSWKKPTAEESDRLTKKMKTYRRTVNRLINERFRQNMHYKYCSVIKENHKQSINNKSLHDDEKI